MRAVGLCAADALAETRFFGYLNHHTGLVLLPGFLPRPPAVGGICSFQSQAPGPQATITWCALAGSVNPELQAEVAVIHVSHLTKYYGDYAAIRDVSFAVPQGKIVGFLGPNGAGKTTTL